MIQGSVDSLKYPSNDNLPEVDWRLANMRSAILRMIRLANALSAQVRLREFRLGLTTREVDVENPFRDILATYATSIRWSGLERPLSLTIDPDLPTIAPHNLIDNASRHNSSESPPETGLCLDEGQTEITVADRGPASPKWIRKPNSSASTGATPVPGAVWASRSRGRSPARTAGMRKSGTTYPWTQGSSSGSGPLPPRIRCRYDTDFPYLPFALNPSGRGQPLPRPGDPVQGQGSP